MDTLFIHTYIHIQILYLCVCAESKQYVVSYMTLVSIYFTNELASELFLPSSGIDRHTIEM